MKQNSGRGGFLSGEQGGKAIGNINTRRVVVPPRCKKGRSYDTHYMSCESRNFSKSTSTLKFIAQKRGGGCGIALAKGRVTHGQHSTKPINPRGTHVVGESHISFTGEY